MKINLRLLLKVFGVLLLLYFAYGIETIVTMMAPKLSSGIDTALFPDNPPVTPGTLPQHRGSITAANASRIVRLAQWGPGAMSNLVWSPDNRMIAAAAGQSIYLYDASTLTQIRLLNHPGTVNPVAFSPDGTLLAAGGYFEGIWIWRVADGTRLRILRGWEAAIDNPPRLFAFSPDGTLLAAGGYWSELGVSDKEGVRLWRLSDGSQTQTFTISVMGYRNIRSVQFSADGTRLFVVSRWSGVQVLRASDGTLEKQINLPDTVLTVLSPDQSAIASSTGDNTLQLRHADGRLIREWGKKTIGMSFAFSPDGKQLATAGRYENMIELWRADDGAFIRGFLWPGAVHGEPSVAYSPDGSLVAVGVDQNIRVWRVDDGVLVNQSPEHTGQIWRMAASPDGKFLASCSDDGTVRLWDWSGKLMRLLQPGAPVLSVAFSPNGEMLSAGTRDNQVRIWRVQEGNRLGEWAGHIAAFSPDRQTVAVANDRSVQLRDVASGAVIREFQGHQAGINSVVYSPDGQFLASGSDDHTVRLWQVSDTGRVQVLAGHTDWVWSVAYSPDGTLLASASRDKTVRVWRTADGSLARVLTGHTDPVTGVAFNADGTVIASASRGEDKVRLWRTNDGNLLSELAPTGQSWSLVFNREGNLLVTGTRDGSLTLWGIPGSP